MKPHRLVLPALILAATAGAAAEKRSPVHWNCTKPRCLCGIPDHDYQYKSRSRSESAVSQTAILFRTNTTVVDAVTNLPPFRTEISGEQAETRDMDDKNRVIVRRKIQETVNSTNRLQTEQLRTAHERLEVSPPSATAVGQIDDRTTFTNVITGTAPATKESRKTVINLYQLDRDRLSIDQCEISQIALQLHDNGLWVLSLRADQNRRPPDGEPAPYNPRLHIKRNQFVVRLRCLGNAAVKPAANAPAAGKPVLAELTPEEFWVQNGQPYYVRTGGSNALVQDHFREIDRVEIEFFYR